MATSLSESARQLLESKNFGTIATVSPNGAPHQVLVWFMWDGADHVLVTTGGGARKARNIEHNGWASLSVHEGPRFLTIRGKATVEHDPATVQRDFSAIVHRYLPPEQAEQWLRNAAANENERVILRIPIEQVFGQG